MPETRRYSLRIDTGLYDRIAAAAAQERRSVPKEIEYAVIVYLENFAKEHRDIDQK